MDNNSNEKIIKKQFTGIVAIIVFAVALAGAIAALYLIASSSPTAKYKKQVNAGDKYFNNLDYDNAILSYEQAIEINPKVEDAYISVANAYIAKAKMILNDAVSDDDYSEAAECLEKALDYLKQGGKQTNSELINDKILEIEELIKMIEKDATPKDEPTVQSNQSGQAEDNNYSEAQKIKKYIQKDDSGKVKILKEYYPNGNLKNQTIYNYGWDVDKWENEYTENGDELRETVYYLDGRKGLTEWIYDENFKPAKTLYSRWDEDTEENYWAEYTYDLKGNKTKVTFLDENGLRGWDEFLYNSNGECYMEKSYDSLGENYHSSEKIFDQNSNVIETIQYEHGILISHSINEYEYDSEGNTIKSVQYDADGNIYQIIEYENGETQKVDTYDKGTLLWSSFYQYDSEGKLTDLTTEYVRDYKKEHWYVEYEYYEY